MLHVLCPLYKWVSLINWLADPIQLLVLLKFIDLWVKRDFVASHRVA
jgi:hypothetical protein